jgi:ABC-type transport system substrate-binding protein
VEVGYKGEGEVVYSMMNSMIEPYYKPVLEKYKHDIDKAKALLTEAGYPDGFEITLLYTDHYEGMDLDAAVLFQDDLADVGIDVTLAFEEYGVYREKAKTMPLLLAGWFPDFLDPDNTMMMTLHGLYGWIGGQGNYGWNNSRYNELGYMGKAETDIAKREDIYDEAQAIHADELPNYPYRECMKNIFMRTWVKDLDLYPLIWAEDESWKEAYLVPRD